MLKMNGTDVRKVKELLIAMSEIERYFHQDEIREEKIKQVFELYIMLVKLKDLYSTYNLGVRIMTNASNMEKHIEKVLEIKKEIEILIESL